MPSLLERKGSGEAKERKPGIRSLVYVSLKRVALVEALLRSCQCAEHEMLAECEHGKEGRARRTMMIDRKGRGQGRTKMKRSTVADSQFRFETSPVDAVLNFLFVFNLTAVGCVRSVEALTASHSLDEHPPGFYGP
jgi:hypothetical protein